MEECEEIEIGKKGKKYRRQKCIRRRKERMKESEAENGEQEENIYEHRTY